MRVSDNGHYLVDDGGRPFFYLADTAWRLFYKLTREDVDFYLRNRRDKGFTVIMPVVLRGEPLTDARNVYGHAPLVDGDPTRPNEAFFAHVDWVIERAEALGLWVALLPTWGSAVGPVVDWLGTNPVIFDEENARAYGEFLGKRYRGRDVIWVLGGDRNPTEEKYVVVWRAIAEGLRVGDGGTHVMTFHPQAPFSSSKWLHDEPWLDFHMIQTSTRLNEQNHLHVLADYNRAPAKPTLNAETRYENSHEVFSPRLIAAGAGPVGEKMTSYHVREAAYGCLLSGAMGHTYGCRDVQTFYVPSDEPPGYDVDTWWKQALDFPGAYHMGVMKRLLTGYPWHELVPDQEHRVIAGGEFVAERLRYVPAAVSADGRFALLYVPHEMRVGVNMDVIAREPVTARWFNPRSGAYQFIGQFPNEGVRHFVTPAKDRGPDYVLVLEGVSGGPFLSR